MGLSYLTIVMLFCLGTGARGGTDLLDMMTTDMYWDAKHQTVTVAQLETDAGPSASPKNLEGAVKDLESAEYKVRSAARREIESIGPAALPLLRTEAQSSDPEVKTAAMELIRELETHSKEREIRRLMAIRTLGEKKEASAVSLLETLEKSDEMFVAAYAGRALAQIQGKAWVRTDAQAALQGDLQLLPDHAAVVAQSSGVLTKPLTIDAIVDETLANPSPMMGMAGRGQKAPTKRGLVQRSVQQLLALTERIGDVRFDGVTVEVSDDAGPEGGSAVVLLRGEYDRAAVVEAMNAAMAGNEGMGKWSEEGKVEVFSQDNVVALMPSNTLAAIVIAAGGEKGVGEAKLKMMASLQRGAGSLGKDQAMGALLKKVDTHGPVWAVARPNKAMREVPVLAGFDALTLSTVIKGDEISFRFAGEGTDAEKVKGSVDSLNGDIAASLTQLQVMAVAVKGLAPVLDLFQSLKVEAAGQSASMTGRFKPALITAGVATIVPMIDLPEIPGGEVPPATQP